MQYVTLTESLEQRGGKSLQRTFMGQLTKFVYEMLAKSFVSKNFQILIKV